MAQLRARFVSGETVAELRNRMTAQLNHLWKKVSDLENDLGKLPDRVDTLDADLDHIFLEM